MRIVLMLLCALAMVCGCRDKSFDAALTEIELFSLEVASAEQSQASDPFEGVRALSETVQRTVSRLSPESRRARILKQFSGRLSDYLHCMDAERKRYLINAENGTGWTEMDKSLTASMVSDVRSDAAKVASILRVN